MDYGGRILSVEHHAYQLQGQSYVKSAAILATSAEYNNPVGTGFSLQRTENYGYDQDFDYLTSVNYGDGSAVQTWEYDAAGNRSSASANPGTWSYDNLNRMIASPGVTYDHDSLGNRMLKTTAGNSTAYGWDAVNRMTSIGPSSSAKTQYSYRADGMRVKKVFPGGDVTRSYYDGQMPVEEDSVVSGTSSVTRNFVGARGIEAIFTTTTSGTTTAFPLYDCHGNMVATIARSGPGFTTSNVRTYDVWGGVRTGATSGGPKGRYVANLGHVQDDESGLIYMRARYYEPESGRFISEDPARDGSNWYGYCSNDSVNAVDPSGQKAKSLSEMINENVFNIALGALASAMVFGVLKNPTAVLYSCMVATIMFALYFGTTFPNSLSLAIDLIVTSAWMSFLVKWTAALTVSTATASKSAGGIALIAISGTVAYSMMLIGLLIGMDVLDEAYENRN